MLELHPDHWRGSSNSCGDTHHPDPVLNTARRETHDVHLLRISVSVPFHPPLVSRHSPPALYILLLCSGFEYAVVVECWARCPVMRWCRAVQG